MAGDLGIFYLFATGGGLSLQTDIQNLVPGTVVLYKTNESENGLKLATVMQSMGELEKTVRTSFPGGAILHVDVSLQAPPPPPASPASPAAEHQTALPHSCWRGWRKLSLSRHWMSPS